jgi:hypothetical protein
MSQPVASRLSLAGLRYSSRREAGCTGEPGNCLSAIGLTAAHMALGVTAFNSPRGFLNGAPFPMFFILAIVTGLATVGDARIIRSGRLSGAPPLIRHLWRMCFALFIAAGSFFSIESWVARILPYPFTTAPMRALPTLLVFVAMGYWWWKVRARRTVLRHAVPLPDAP